MAVNSNAAMEIGARGVFITMQVNPRFDLPGDDPDRTGFKEIINHLREWRVF